LPSNVSSTAIDYLTIHLWSGLLYTVSYRFCKFDREAENTSRAKPSPAHTKNRRDRLDRGSHLGISFDPSVLNHAEMWGKRSIHSIVNLQEQCMIISFWSWLPMQ